MGFAIRIKATNPDRKLSEYFKILSNPILTNIRIGYHYKNVRNLTDSNFDVLYSGNDIIISGKIQNVKNLKNINVSAIISAKTVYQTDSNDTLMVKDMDITWKIDIDLDIYGIENGNTEKLITYNDNINIEMDDDEETEQDPEGLELGL